MAFMLLFGIYLGKLESWTGVEQSWRLPSNVLKRFDSDFVKINAISVHFSAGTIDSRRQMIPLLKMAKMKICGLEKLRVFFSLILMVSLMCHRVNGFTVVRSTAANGAGVPDLFSNPSCRPSDCISFASVCATKDCCSCQCLKTRATYVILPVNRCVAQEYIDEGETSSCYLRIF